MWKQNRLGGYEQTPVKTGTKKQKNPIRSGWYSHPESGEPVWYDSKTNQFRDKVGGPAREALSIGWRLTGGKDAADLVGMTIKGAKKVVPPLYKATKKTIGDAKEVIDDAVTSTKNLAKELLVSKTSPSYTAKDATGITKGKNQAIEDIKILNKESAAKPDKVENTTNNSKKKNKDLLIKKKTDPFADVGYE